MALKGGFVKAGEKKSFQTLSAFVGEMLQNDSGRNPTV